MGEKGILGEDIGNCRLDCNCQWNGGMTFVRFRFGKDPQGYPG